MLSVTMLRVITTVVIVVVHVHLRLLQVEVRRLELLPIQKLKVVHVIRYLKDLILRIKQCARVRHVLSV